MMRNEKNSTEKKGKTSYKSIIELAKSNYVEIEEREYT